MGRSGSGKSVTLRLMDGLERPDEGSIVFDGTDIVSLPERDLYPMRHRVAMLFQGGALFDSMTVFDNLAFQLERHSSLGGEEIVEKVTRTLELVELEGAEEKMPSALSGGMRKRAALARSLIMDPEVVLFDEPTTGLDPVTSATIAQLIRSIQSRLQMTSVVVTHDVHLARRVGDLVAFLENGRFAFFGTWQEAADSGTRSLHEFLRANEESDAA
jgi:phospholipid/cholesterol/gamma-HCH transport system ATP-binding protein